MGAFLDEMIELHRGQGMELWHRDNLVCPSEEDYYTMVRNSMCSPGDPQRADAYP